MLERVRVQSVFVLRTVDPPLASVEGTTVRAIRRVGKRIAIGMDGDLWLVLHLMIAGRLHWKPAGAKLAGKNALLAFDFLEGSLTLTEAGSKRRASLHVLRGEEGLRSADPGGLEIFSADGASPGEFRVSLDEFRAALSLENRTLKRALTDPRIVSGIGNAYSDEILHAAQLSPIALTQKLKPGEWERLFGATRETLTAWIERLSSEARKKFPEGVTAFRPRWPCMGASASRARAAGVRCSVFAMQTTRRTTAHPARRAAKCWQTGAYRGCWEPTGRVRSTSWRR
jgi:formamidopyrimidine-DNA glycosylase